MDRAERAGISVAVAGHILLFGVLSLGVSVPPSPRPKPPPAMEVEFVQGVAPEPVAVEPLAEATAQAPEIGPVEEAMPNAAPPAQALPPPPPVELAPPPPAPAPPKPAPVAAKPIPKPAPPKPKPVAAKPKPQPVAKAKPTQAKPAQAKPTPAKAKPAPAKAVAKTASTKTSTIKAPSTIGKSAPGSGAPASGKGQKTAATAPRLGKNFLAGLSDPVPAKANKPAAVAAAISADAMAGIQSAIKRQIQPCANRQVNPGPGASRILVKLNLKLNKDGSLASAPRVVSTSGVDDENSRYEKRVADLAIAAYTGCAPMRGLPVDLYRTAKGGWSNVNMNYKLPG